MTNQSHYLIPGSKKSNFADETVPLRVNCVGYCMRLKPFSTVESVGRNDYYLQYVVENELIIKADCVRYRGRVPFQRAWLRL